MTTGRHDAYEPSAATRASAKVLHEIYVALVKEGFTEQEALQVVGQVIVASFMTNDGKS